MSKKLDNNNRIELTIHILVWVVLFYIPVALTYRTESTWAEIALHFWLQLALMAVIFYLNYLWLVEKWLFSKGRKMLFVLINIGLLLLIAWFRYLIFSTVGGGPEGNGHKGPPIGFIWYMDFFIYLIPVAFAIAIRSGKHLTNMERFKAEAENIKLQSELQHLKFQLQPHFFFNALNNIYSLIETEPQKARESIHSMSKLMRHLLQASEENTTTLQNEIEFLKKYIALMEVRLSSQTKVVAIFPDNVPPVQIVPLLFISIVENAFKHGVSATQQSNIYFAMKIENSTIIFKSRNSLLPKSNTDLSGSGIGLENLKKRLALLYPGRHHLKIDASDNEFNVELQIEPG